MINSRSTTRRHARAALLLEALLALVIFVTAGLTILSLIGQATDSAATTRLKAQALDLARSAIAKLEAGIETAETLNGPVPLWTDAGAEGSNEFDDAPAEPSGWSLEIATEPSSFGKLTRVSVTAMRQSPDGLRTLATCTLVQLVRLSSATGESDSAGAQDAINNAAERGAAEELRRSRRNTPIRSGDGGSRGRGGGERP